MDIVETRLRNIVRLASIAHVALESLFWDLHSSDYVNCQQPQGPSFTQCAAMGVQSSFAPVTCVVGFHHARYLT